MQITSLNSLIGIFLLLASTLSLSNTASTTAAYSNHVYAKKITVDNAAKLVRKGPDAIGGIDDWFITNGTLCAIVSGLEHEGEFSAKGGSLVDLGFCGRADDHFSFAHDLLQGNRRRPLDSNKIEIEQSADSATIVVHGERDGATIITRYSLSLEHPTELHIEKRLSAQDDSDFNFLSLLNFNYHSLEPFVFNSKNLDLSAGFKAEDFVSRGISAMDVAARDADTIITLSPPSADHGIAYGWHLASAERVQGDERYSVPRFVLADDSSNVMIVLTDTFYIGDGQRIGWLQLPQFPLLSLAEEASIETKEIIYVGKRGDVASITDQFFSDEALVTGRIIDEADSAIHILQQSGVPLSHVRPNSDGTFNFRAPQGEYQLIANGSAKRSTKIDIELNQKSLNLAPLRLPAPARVKLPQGDAMRLVFVGLNDTPTPDFSDWLTGFSVMEEDGEHFIDPVSNIFLAGIEGDPTSVELVPGDYRVYATRGPEFSLEKREFSIKAQQTVDLEITTPIRVVETPKYIASDLHVHSGISFDNAFSESERVRTFVAEHGEVMVSSEHDVPVDYAPRIRAMGVDSKIVSIAAAEVTSLLPTELNPYTNGHANFFPFPPEENEYRRGMVNHEDQRWRDVIHAIKQKHPEIISQLNHARLTLELSAELPSDWQEIVDNGHFLEHMGKAAHPYNPTQGLHSHPNNTLIEPHAHTGVRDIDFDLIEVINPGGVHNEERIQALRKDWLSFVKQGEKMVATANSDSHRASQQVAVPRTMVAMSDDRVTHFNQREFLLALKSGNAYGTTGPIISVSLSGMQMGETFSGTRGQLSLDIQSAKWIPLSEVKVQINGETIDQYTLSNNDLKAGTKDDEQNNQHSLLIPLQFERDSFVTIEVYGPVSEDYAHVYPLLQPYAFSNPIYVDFDSDGKWTPPGL